jgi:hypothetical protein
MVGVGRSESAWTARLRAGAQLGLALSPWVPSGEPTSAAAVTASWLTERIGRAHAPGAVATAVRPLGGTSGTTDRQRLAVSWNEAGVQAGLPSAMFVKSTPRSAKNRTMVGALDMAVNEVHFYRDVAADLGDIVPKAWFTHAAGGARHLLVLEDLTARGCTPLALADSCDLAHAEAMIDCFARLHAAFWADRRLGTQWPWARTWTRRPGYGVLKRFYRQGRAGALKRGGPVSPPVQRLVAALNDRADVYYRLFEAGPLTLLHGDSHLGNTFRMPDGRGGLLDWQVVWQGPGLREVSYFLVTGLEPDLRAAHERDLLARYADGLRAHGVSADDLASDAFAQYRLFAAEAWDAAAMTVAWPGLQAPENVAASWRRSCAAVEDLEVDSAVAALSSACQYPQQ